MTNTTSKAGAKPLIAIVGETASGKSGVAMELAERFGGEIICADSRTIYRGMDIGTAKPTPEDRERVPHHMLDLIEPDQAFSAAQFKELAIAAIADITARGKLPLLVGGTGLYVDAVLFDYQFGPLPDPAERERLNAMEIPELQAEVNARDLPMPKNLLNKRHLTRLLETNGQFATHGPLRENTWIYALDTPRDLLKSRIQKRINDMIAAGFVDEVNHLVGQYGWDAPGMQAPNYRAFKLFIDGKMSMPEAKEQFIQNDLRLAKRQRTWFKRNNSIQWARNRGEIVASVTTVLNKSA